MLSVPRYTTIDGSTVGRAGPLAAIGRKPRQARKGATVATDSGAGMWLVRCTSTVYRRRPSRAPGQKVAASPMSYQVLARKWRPRSFAEVAGQEHVLRALINALDTGRLHHAYLFTGTRGVGKTTLARILAKCLNCETGVTSSPCGSCRACTEIDEGRFLDLIEIDAASRTGVDDTRDLLDNVAYAPSMGRFKVYLIDEVHMFSRSSFNALLKTLEEPPEHVKFVLATTDPQKVPVTVLSRCLQFNLKRFPVVTIANQLQRVLEAESVPAERTALETLAQAGEGSMRDAMSLLDQALAFGAGAVTATDVQRMLGAVDEPARFDLLEAVASGDASAVLAKVASLDEFAPDYEALLGDIVSMLHAIAIHQSVPEVAEHPVNDTARLQALAETIPPEDVQLFYQIGLVGRRDQPLVPVARHGFEMTLLRMMAFRPAERGALDSAPAAAVAPTPAPAPATTGPAARPADQLRAAVAGSQAPKAARVDTSRAAPETRGAVEMEHAPPQTAQPVVSAPAVTPVQSSAAPPAPIAPAAALELNADNWTEIVAALPVKGMPLQLAMHSVPQSRGANAVTLQLPQAHQHLAAPAFCERLQASLESYLGRSVSLDVQLATSELASPAQQKALDVEARQRQAEQAIYNDPVVQQLQNRFDGEVQADSIRPVDDGADHTP